MINNHAINQVGLNSPDISNLSVTDSKITSFSANQITKYAFKTVLGEYFNIGDFGEYSSGVCGVGQQKKYGNILLDTDIENTSEKYIGATENSILDGGKIHFTRLNIKEFYFTINIFSDSLMSIEKEIQAIKKNLNLEGLKVIKKERNRVSSIGIEVESIEVGKISKRGTEVTISCVSVDPTFKKVGTDVRVYRNLSGNLDTSLIVTDTDKKPFLETYIDIRSVSGTITGIILTVDGYPVEIATSISSPVPVVFDGENVVVKVGSQEVKDFKGKFVQFPINRSVNIKCEFIGGTADEYNIYFYYNNIFQ